VKSPTSPASFNFDGNSWQLDNVASDDEKLAEFIRQQIVDTRARKMETGGHVYAARRVTGEWLAIALARERLDGHRN
jgi:hypothetical protein